LIIFIFSENVKNNDISGLMFLKCLVVPENMFWVLTPVANLSRPVGLMTLDCGKASFGRFEIAMILFV
jgi:hypothetical protein